MNKRRMLEIKHPNFLHHIDSWGTERFWLSSGKIWNFGLLPHSGFGLNYFLPILAYIGIMEWNNSFGKVPQFLVLVKTFESMQHFCFCSLIQVIAYVYENIRNFINWFPQIVIFVQSSICFCKLTLFFFAIDECYSLFSLWSN